MISWNVDDGVGAGTTFLCSVLIAPVKNENNDVILFILNLEDITDAPVKTDVHRHGSRKSGMVYTDHVTRLFVLFVLLSWRQPLKKVAPSVDCLLTLWTELNCRASSLKVWSQVRYDYRGGCE